MADRWRQIEEMFHRALEREEPDRAAFLDEACAGDAALRREVESLLAEEAESGFMETPAMEGEARELAQEKRPRLEGRRIGTFEILSPLGRGGMGEVWRARDSKLKREVAVKTLPEEFANDKERLARFEREATLLASLNHPNIATIHGLEEDGGTRFLVLELVEGDTLADRLERGAIPVEESVKLALQIAEALEAAHEKGVIHRDLKPANIKVTPDGRVKVLDFGLAKALAGDGADVNLSQSPTLSLAATQQGVILGTAAYMSPEQARGQEVDKRTDVWAFGCVFYELLAGRRLWVGSNVADLIAAVVAKDADLSNLPITIHPRLPELLRRCVEKDPRNRFYHVGDLRVELEAVERDPIGKLFSPPATAVQARRPHIAVALAGLLFAAVGGFTTWSLIPTPPRLVTRSIIPLLPTDSVSFAGCPVVLDLSPDGTHLAYVANDRLYLRRMADREARLIPGTEGARGPFFSADGQWIGYSTDTGLMRVRIAGGSPEQLTREGGGCGAVWGSNGVIAYSPRANNLANTALVQVPDGGGTPRPLTTLDADRGEIDHHRPQFLPGNRLLYSVAHRDPNLFRIVVEDLSSGERTDIGRGQYARFLPTDHLVYSPGNGQGMMVAPFDLNRLERTGDPVQLAESIDRDNMGISSTGSFVFVPDRTQSTKLVWLDAETGEETPLGERVGVFQWPRISPNGEQVATQLRSEDAGDIWIYQDGLFDRLTLEGATHPVWSPDGSRIVMSIDEEGSSGFYEMPADKSAGRELLVSRPVDSNPNSWSVHDRIASYEWGGDQQRYDIWILDVQSGDSQEFLATPAMERAPAFSPQGNWLAYVSDENGRQEIFVKPYPDNTALKHPIAEGISPVWAPHGGELYFLKDGVLMAVPVQTAPVFRRLDDPHRIHPGPFVTNGANAQSFDIHPDGKRFLMTQVVVENSSPEIHFIQNWFEELKERVPVP